MKFAILGDHGDGLEMAQALAATGRHEASAYLGPTLGLDYLQRHGLTPKAVGDLEDILADPEITLVIVAIRGAKTGKTLRRALQSERHVLAVHPVDPKPDLAFEAALIQGDTKRIALPLLPEAFHPGVARFAELLRGHGPGLLEMDRWSPEEICFNLEGADPKPGLPGWDVIRRAAGEIVEVFGMAAGDELMPGQPVLVSGKLSDDRLFRANFLPQQREPRWRLALVGPRLLELTFPEGWPGPAELRFVDADGVSHAENWPPLPPWEPLVEAFEALIAKGQVRSLESSANEPCWTKPIPQLGWTDEIRALDIDDNIRRSLHYRRAYILDLQEATEEAGFKGTMTLVGCSLMWIILVTLFLSTWLPWLRWLIFPALGVFLVLQGLRWVIRDRGEGAGKGE